MGQKQEDICWPLGHRATTKQPAANALSPTHTTKLTVMRTHHGNAQQLFLFFFALPLKRKQTMAPLFAPSIRR